RGVPMQLALRHRQDTEQRQTRKDRGAEVMARVIHGERVALTRFSGGRRPGMQIGIPVRHRERAEVSGPILLCRREERDHREWDRGIPAVQQVFDHGFFTGGRARAFVESAFVVSLTGTGSRLKPLMCPIAVTCWTRPLAMSTVIRSAVV